MQRIPIAIVAALDEEIRTILSKMAIDSRVHVRPSLFVSGKYLGREVLVVRSGIGPKAMENAIGYCLDRYSPAFCLHVGYCGAADPHFQAGDLLIASRVTEARDDKYYDADQNLVDRAAALCSEKKLRYRTGGLVTVEDVVNQPHEKAFIGTAHEAQGIDMESFVLAAACTAKDTPYLIVRAVFDPLDVELPNMDGVIDSSGDTNVSRLAGHIIKNPKDILAIPRLKYLAIEARNSITAFVDAWVEKV